MELYGYTIEIKLTSGWRPYFGNKIYSSLEIAKDALEQISKGIVYPKFEFRILKLFKTIESE